MTCKSGLGICFMDVAALIISILAFLLSILVALAESKRDYKITKISIEFEFYREIYKDHLIKKIPEARKYMWISKDGYLKDSQPLIDELNEIRRDSLYFLYNNKSFYSKLKKKLQKLEDYLIKSEAALLVGEEQTAFLDSIQEQLNGIYEVISQAYCGEFN